MPRQAQQSNKWDFTVEQVPAGEIEASNGVKCRPGGFFNVRTDTGENIGYTTEKYGLIQNGDVIGAAESAFEALKDTVGDFERNIIVSGKGERLFATYDFKNYSQKLKKVGDEIGMRLTVQNSFDRTLRFSLAVGALRLVCTNGMTTLEKDVSMTARHMSGINTNFVKDAVEKASQKFMASCGVFEKFASVKFNQIQGFNFLNRLQKNAVISGRIKDGVLAIWNDPTFSADAERNMWNLYNAATQYLTHTVANSRYEYANKVGADLLKTFAKVAKNGKAGDWVEPIEVDAVVQN